jgi:hypothetical protein
MHTYIPCIHGTSCVAGLIMDGGIDAGWEKKAFRNRFHIATSGLMQFSIGIGSAFRMARIGDVKQPPPIRCSEKSRDSCVLLGSGCRGYCSVSVGEIGMRIRCFSKQPPMACEASVRAASLLRFVGRCYVHRQHHPPAH